MSIETYQEVDDWEQMTFYNITGMINENRDSAIIIQLAKPLNEYWESIIIPRIKKFFDEKIYDSSDDIKLLSLQLLNKDNQVLKDYLAKDVSMNIENISLNSITKMEPVKYIVINDIEIRQEDVFAVIDDLDNYEDLNDYDMPCGYDTLKALCDVGLLEKKCGERQATIYCIKNEELRNKIMDFMNKEG